VTARAPLVEIFVSIQGEGRFVGQPMAFVRTAVCPIRCLYCDTPHSHAATASWTLHGEGGPIEGPNPVDVTTAVEALRWLDADGLPVSITGGEPLVHPEFVRELGAELRAGGHRIHLETAALHPGKLAECIASIDHLSADYKLPGTLQAGDFRAQHRACIAAALERGLTVDVKVVLTPAIDDAVLDAALADLEAFRAAVVLVLQPVTPFGAVAASVDGAVVQRWAERARARGFGVLVLPQLHRALGVR
jgi:organic radical activating enzyme